MDNMGNEPRKTVGRRVQRTKRAIRNAFAQLISEREINDITVRDIADLAEINRKTFYNYYSGIYQIVDEVENDIVASFGSVLGEIDLKTDLVDPYPIFEKLTAVIVTDLDFYGYLFTMSGNLGLMRKIVEVLKEKTRRTVLLQSDIDEEKLDVMLDYAFSGMIAVFQRWFVSSRETSVEELSKVLGTICIRGFDGIIDMD
jgi:AcrR family transcriptional regulator